MQIFFSPTSPYVRKCLVTAYELGLIDLIEFLPANAHPVNRDAHIIASNPPMRFHIEAALRAVGAGAYDFLCKPVNPDELRMVLRRCVYLAGLENEYRALQQQLRPKVFENMLASSPEMHAVFEMIRKVAASSAPVLVLGEHDDDGVGAREMLGRAGAAEAHIAGLLHFGWRAALGAEFVAQMPVEQRARLRDDGGAAIIELGADGAGIGGATGQVGGGGDAGKAWCVAVEAEEYRQRIVRDIAAVAPQQVERAAH